MLALCAANIAYLTGLESAVPGGACVVAGTGAPIAQMLRRGGVTATTLDEHPDILRAVGDAPLSSGVVLGAAPVVSMLEELGCDAVLPFKSGARLWTMAEFQGLRVLAAPHKLTRQLENKLALAELAAAADAQIPDTVTVRLDDDFAAAARADGIALPRVFQPAVGFAGEGTVLLRNAGDIEELVRAVPPSGTVGKLVEYVAGDPVTVNGVVIPPGVHGSHPEHGEVLVGMVTRQLTGIAGLTPTDFGSCGNDWSQPPDRGSITAVRALAHRMGEVLATRGFAGAFGVDVIIPERGGVPVLIEINPRWTASLALQVELQALARIPTLLDAHLAAFAYRPDERASLGELVAAYGPDEDAGCTRGVQRVSTVIAYNTGPDAARIDPAAAPGVWRQVPGHDDHVPPVLERVRDGWRCADLEAEGELVVLPGGVERPIGVGSYLVRVIRRGPAAADPAARALTAPVASTMRDVVRLVRTDD